MLFRLNKFEYKEWYAQRPPDRKRGINYWWSFTPIGNWKRRRALKRAIKLTYND